MIEFSSPSGLEIFTTLRKLLSCGMHNLSNKFGFVKLYVMISYMPHAVRISLTLSSIICGRVFTAETVSLRISVDGILS